MYSVFVSYAQEQVDWATYLRKVLNGPGIIVYVAEHDLAPGTSLSTSIAQQVKASDLFILLWTEDAKSSRFVANEVFLAKTENRPIIPVLLQSGVQLPSELGDIKYLDIVADPKGHVKWIQADVAQRAKNKQLSSFIALGITTFLAWAILRGND